MRAFTHPPLAIQSIAINLLFADIYMTAFPCLQVKEVHHAR